MRVRRLIAGLAAGAGLVAGALLGPATMAQAYSPNPSTDSYSYRTVDCPCSEDDFDALDDPFGGTTFSADDGGTAVKVELYDDTDWFVGKVEFHPRGEHLRIYDTRNDDDTFYVSVTVFHDGVAEYLGTYRPPGSSSVVDMRDLVVPLAEGDTVSFSLYDDADRDDRFGGTYSGIG